MWALGGGGTPPLRKILGILQNAFHHSKAFSANLEPLSSAGLFLWSSALGGEPYDLEGLGNRVEWNHLSQPNKTVPGGNATETCKTVTKVG